MSYNEAKFAAMGDLEVVEELWRTIEGVEDADLSDDLYWLTGEILERWAPEIERATTERCYAQDPNRENELRDHAKALARRARLRKVLRDFQEEEVNA